MEEFAGRQEEDLSAREMFGNAGDLFGSLIPLGRDLARYSTVRNRLLLENGLGLGEYTWIYVVAFFGWLGHEPVRFMASSDHQRIYRDRVAGQIRGMIERGLEQGESPVDAFWRDELAALVEDPRRLPFAEGLAPSLAGSLEPNRARLEAAYCPATDELDLMRTRRSGLKFEHD